MSPRHVATGYACSERVESRSWTGDIACNVTGEMSETEESEADSRKTITGRAHSETGVRKRDELLSR